MKKENDGNPSGWTIEKGEKGSIHFASPVISFRAGPENGGTLYDLDWPGSGPLPAVSMMKVLPCMCITYDQRRLNLLRDGIRGGEETALEYRVEGPELELRGTLSVHDLLIESAINASAETGQLEATVSVRKNGAGSIKVQVVHELFFPVRGVMGTPRCLVDFAAGGRELTRCEYGREGKIWDQDGHATRRAWVLDRDAVRFRSPGSGRAIEAEIDASPACLFLGHSPLSGYLSAMLYGRETLFEKGTEQRSRVTLKPAVLTAREIKRVPRLVKDARTSRMLEEFVSRPAPVTAPGTPEPVARFRRELIDWKIAEARWSLADGSPAEARGLLRDAVRARQALEEGEPAEMPGEGGELIYENSFRSFPADFRFFGFGDFRSDPERGLFVRPSVTTVNLWSEREFSGDYMVTFDYFPEKPAGLTGCGTFLQLSGRTVGSRDRMDFMASATGSMPDYNHGVSCYHFSFNRHSPKRDRTNFRKTGRDFRILSLTETMTGQEPRWYRVCAVKRGRQFLFFMDGEFILEYFDEGNQGPYLDRGHLGLRNWGGMVSWFRDLRVRRLE